MVRQLVVRLELAAQHPPPWHGLAVVGLGMQREVHRVRIVRERRLGLGGVWVWVDLKQFAEESDS